MNFNSYFSLLLISYATSINLLPFKNSVISTKHSSIENRSTLYEYSSNNLYSISEYFL